MPIVDLKFKEALANIPKHSIPIAETCLQELKKCKEVENKYKGLSTAPSARRILTNFIEQVVGHNRMNILFPAYCDELNDFVNEDAGVITFLDCKAHVVTQKVSELQKHPYPTSDVIIYNPHIGSTSEGYFVRLSALTSLITLYDNWIRLIEEFLTLVK